MAVKDPLKGIGKMITDLEKGKTGVKTVDMQKRKDAALTKNLKRMAKRTKVRAKPQTLDITPKPGSAFSIQKETITMAKDGGLMEAIEKVKAKEMETGGEATPKPKTVKKAIADKVVERAKTSVVKSKKGPKLTKTGKQIVRSVKEDFPELFKRATKMETGGEAVPKKFKGFSKLPEAVQEKMDPTLAKKFEDGGPVKMGSGGGVCRGMGIARAGGKFKLR